MTKANNKIEVEGSAISILKNQNEDYVSLTDMAKFKNETNTGLVISHWLSTRFAVDFLGIWEQMNNPHFNLTEFSNIRFNAGSNGFVLSVKQWIERTGAIGIISSTGRYGGTYAHKDIAFEFGSWLSPEFKFYLIREYQRLKDEEQAQLGWSAKRELAKINYRIHTDAIKQNLIPPELIAARKSFVYADEADMLNVAMFGQTAREWRIANPELKGNIRDYATINQLICLSNMENLNAVFINDGLPQSERLEKLNKIAIQQMQVLENLSEHQPLTE